MDLMVTPKTAHGTTAVLLEGEAGLGLRRVRWWDRLLARTRSSALDRALAAGARPEASLRLAVHADRLCEPAQCRLLARSLTRIAAASEAPSGRGPQVPVCRTAVRQVRHELRALAGRLSAPGPVDVHGVARVRTLLTDGTGPLYQPCPPERLHRELADALAALDSFD